MTADAERSRLTNNAILAVLQVVVATAVLFTLFRYLVHTLGAEAVGLWSLVTALTAPTKLGELGLGTTTMRFVAKHLARGGMGDAASAVTTATLTIAGIVLVVSVVAFPCLYWLLPLLTPSAAELSEARQLLPYVVLSIWLAAISNSIRSGLIGCHRADLASWTQMVAQLLWLAASVLLVPKMGLKGLALGQALQHAFFLTVGVYLLRQQLPGLRSCSSLWSRNRLSEMWVDGVMQQLVSLATLLGEPVAKVIIGHFGGLAILGFFEMANRFVGQVRLLLASANQVLVPYFTKLSETTKDGVTLSYVRNVRTMTLAGSILFSVVGVTLPFIGSIWVGKDVDIFVTVGLLLCVGWFVNLLSVPAFFANVSAGHLHINLFGQIATGLASAAVGVAVGFYFGVASVVGWPVGLVSGAVVVMWLSHRRQRLSIAAVFDIRSVAPLVLGSAVVVVGILSSRWLFPQHISYVGFLCSLALLACSWVPFLLLVPEGRALVVALVKRKSKQEYQQVLH